MNGILKDKSLCGEIRPKNNFTFVRAWEKEMEAIKAGKQSNQDFRIFLKIVYRLA